MNYPIVFLPGMMCDARLFAPQVAACGSDRTVQVAHLAGANSMQKLAAEVLENAPPSFVLCGLSMGGIVAMEVVRQAAERVKGLVLMDTNPRAEAEEVKELRGPQIDEVKQGGLAKIMQEVMIPRYLYQPDAEIESVCLQMALQLGDGCFIAQSEALRDRPDQQETLSAYQHPSLVLCGDSDKLCPLDRHTLMDSLLPNSELIVIKECGHLPTLEHPLETNAQLTHWLDRNGL